MKAKPSLAERLRPQRLEEVLGQQHLLSADKPLARQLQGGYLQSCLLWGPPGVGKTTLARLMSHYIQAHFEALSAVSAGVKALRQVTEEATQRLQEGIRTLLFIDEVHRFNKAQQDFLLPFVEDGTVIFVGATTENPSFEINPALRSRCHLYVLRALADDGMKALITRALHHPQGLNLKLEPEAIETIIAWAQGDARRALSLLELLAAQVSEDGLLTNRDVKRALTEKDLGFDKGGDHFYHLISALHKSVRGCHVDASLYYLARMLEAGADPLYVARRLIRIASEDVGLADPNALRLALAAKETVAFLGLAEGELALAQATIYLAIAPKSNAIYRAYTAAKQDAQTYAQLEVPLHLRNAPSELLKNLDYGRGYAYYFDDPEASFLQSYFPEALAERRYYTAGEEGWERKVQERLSQFEAMRKAGIKKKPYEE